MRRLSHVVLLATVAALLLRTAGAAHPFETSDNAELALRVIDHRGITWIFGERYGFLNPLAVKLFAAIWSDALGLSLNEALFKLPVALMGTAQVWLSYRFARRLEASASAAVLLALITAVFPLHVMQSRYLWGYEVFGLFFLTLAFWKLADFYEQPSSGAALASGVATALYLISHGFIVPFFAFAAFWAWYHGLGRSLALFRHHKAVWVVPLLYVPFLAPALRHTADKKAKFGFYLLDYLEPMLANVGVPLAILAMVGLGAYILRGARSRYVAPLLALGVLYFMPLLLGARPGSTVTRGYMLIGSYAVVTASLLALDASLRGGLSARKPVVLAAVAVVVAATGWGTYESVFLRDESVDPTLVRQERGSVPVDPGSKAVGLYLRRHVPEEQPVIAVHPALEPPNARYYLGRDVVAFYDLSEQDLALQLAARVGGFAIAVTSPALDPGPGFEVVADIRARGTPVAQIHARPELGLPRVQWDVSEVNPQFDVEYPVTARF